MTPFLQPRFGTSLSLPTPAVDITEEEGAFKVSAEVPGMSEKDIDVSLSGDALTIKGEKRQERDMAAIRFGKDRAVPRRQIRDPGMYGSLSRGSREISTTAQERRAQGRVGKA